jgi:hypothetical protein
MATQHAPITDLNDAHPFQAADDTSAVPIHMFLNHFGHALVSLISVYSNYSEVRQRTSFPPKMPMHSRNFLGGGRGVVPEYTQGAMG